MCEFGIVLQRPFHFESIKIHLLTVGLTYFMVFHQFCISSFSQVFFNWLDSLNYELRFESLESSVVPIRRSITIQIFFFNSYDDKLLAQKFDELEMTSMS